MEPLTVFVLTVAFLATAAFTLMNAAHNSAKKLNDRKLSLSTTELKAEGVANKDDDIAFLTHVASRAKSNHKHAKNVAGSALSRSTRLGRSAKGVSLYKVTYSQQSGSQTLRTGRNQSINGDFIEVSSSKLRRESRTGKFVLSAPHRSKAFRKHQKQK